MTKVKLLFLLAAFGLFTFVSCDDDDDPVTYEEIVVSVNRGAANVSFVDATTNNVVKQLAIPGSEPMYAVYVAKTDRVYVGDRAQSKVHIINPATMELESDIAVGNGVFHMWADGQGEELWVNNDMDNTISVINLASKMVVQTIDVGQKPHDVFVDATGTRAYVSTIVGDETVADSILMYDANTYMKTGSQAVGDDPHLFHIPAQDKLFVPCQSGTVYVLNEADLSEMATIDAPNAHGVYSANGENLYVTNIGGAGLFNINTATNMLVGSGADTPVATPHNIVVNEANTKMFVTHSGASANQLSVYTLNGDNIEHQEDLVTNTNPFGIAYYKRQK